MSNEGRVGVNVVRHWARAIDPHGCRATGTRRAGS